MGAEKWGHKFEYVLTVLGFACGVGAVWKFPYMCARNGGGSFLIPYLFFTFIGTVPLTYLETFVGQFSQRGPFTAWQICPALQGLGIGSVLLTWTFSVYNPVIFSWVFYFLYYSFQPVLPWTLCEQSWNTDDCQTYHQTNVSTNENATRGVTVASNETSSVPSGEEFFFNNMLEVTSGLGHLGNMRWPLIGCLAMVFVCVYVCIARGIKISGKIVYVTVTAPYILVTVILVRALTLPGSVDGILYYIVPQFDKLKEPRVWIEACGLALYFMSAGFGSLINMSSHNSFSNDCLRDAVSLNAALSLSLIYFGFSVFAVTGHLAHIRGISFEDFQTSGFKLGFITYPEATSFLPLPQLWSVLLFVMFFTLGIDTLIPAYEVISRVFVEWFPRLGRRLWLLNLFIILVSFLLATPLTLQGGVYILVLVEWFAFFPSLAVFAFVELTIVGWIYGKQRCDKALTTMSGKGLPKIMEIMWKYVCPILLLIVFGNSVYTYRPPRFEEFVYPAWANAVGWLLSMAIVLPIPIFFVYVIWKTPGNSMREKLTIAFTPTGPWLHCNGDENELQIMTQDLVANGKKL